MFLLSYLRVFKFYVAKESVHKGTSKAKSRKQSCYKMENSYVVSTLKAMGYNNVKINVLHSLNKALKDYILALAKDSNYFHPSEFERPDYKYLVRILTRNGIMMAQLMDYCLIINLRKCRVDNFYVGDKSEYSEPSSVQQFQETKNVQAVTTKTVNNPIRVRPVHLSTPKKCTTLRI